MGGTSLDYVYDRLGVDFSFAVEIYVSPEYVPDLEERYEEKLAAPPTALSLLQRRAQAGGALLAHNKKRLDAMERFLAIQLKKSQSQSSATSHKSDSGSKSTVTSMAHSHDESCFQLFNPATKTDFFQTLDNWTGAYLQLAD